MKHDTHAVREHRHQQQGEHAPGGGHEVHLQGPVGWATASKAALHCLMGCAFGEILGMIIGTALAWHDAPTMALAIALAFLFGYSFTLYAVIKAGLSLRAAIGVALA